MGDSVHPRGTDPVSFSCPHFDLEEDHCRLLRTDCVPGRRGCVLAGKSVFAVPAEERVRLREAEKREQALARQFAAMRPVAAKSRP